MVQQGTTHGSLFSGIGGFDLAAQWMGWNNSFHCEVEDFLRKILKHYWPKSISYGDITKTDFSVHRGHIDVLTGGFPCQPYSNAGKRLGTEDERHLWPHFLRAIREISPGWVVGENVRGLTNWNDGLVFDEVQADLEAAGYEVTPFLLPACGVNAPHRRDRIWFIAYNHLGGQSERKLQAGREVSQNSTERKWATANAESNGVEGNRPKGQQVAGSPLEEKISGCHNRGDGWERFPTQHPVCSGNDGLSSRLDGITFSKWRNESIKGYGNAVVPQVAYQIFKTIESYEKLRRLEGR